jgi:hypothetical protein
MAGPCPVKLVISDTHELIKAAVAKDIVASLIYVQGGIR